MKTTMRIETGGEANATFLEAVKARELEQNVKITRNGYFIVWEFFDVTALDMFKLGQAFSRITLEKGIESC